jgi:hypothetical protein
VIARALTPRVVELAIENVATSQASTDAFTLAVPTMRQIFLYGHRVLVGFLVRKIPHGVVPSLRTHPPPFLPRAHGIRWAIFLFGIQILHIVRELVSEPWTAVNPTKALHAFQVYQVDGGRRPPLAVVQEAMASTAVCITDGGRVPSTKHGCSPEHLHAQTVCPFPVRQRE